MKRLISAVLLLTFLNGCSLPLVGSLTSSTVTGVATGNYQRSLVSGSIDLAVHKTTGKTPGQHLYAAVENKYTEKKLKKHFPNKELKIRDFQLSWKDYGPDISPTMASVKNHSVKRPVSDYRVEYYTNQSSFLFFNYN
jgi:hypothetical protein